MLIVEPNFGNSRNIPETPRFKDLLQAHENHTASEGLNRSKLDDMLSLISNSPGWRISEHAQLSIPHTGPFWNTDVLTMYNRWIDLIQQYEQIDFAYNLVRQEVELWSKEPNTFSQIGLHIFYLQTC